MTVIKRLLYFLLIYMVIQFSWDAWFLMAGSSYGWTVESQSVWESEWTAAATFVFICRTLVGYIIANSITNWLTADAD